jgi:hypothetical protein
MSVVNPSNPANPQDIIGQQHNQIVSAVLANHLDEILQVQDENERQELTTQLVVSTADAMGLNDGQDPTAFFGQLPGYNGLLSSVDFEHEYAAIIDCFPDLFPWTRDRFRHLLDIVVPMPVETEEEVNQVLNAIIAFENETLESGEADETLLRGIAVTKFSLYGWFMQPPVTDTAARIDWNCVIVDGVGAIAGGLMGAAAASTVYKLCTT